MQARTGHMHIGLKEEGVVEFILGILNPMSLATFAAFFGLTGMVLSLAVGLPPLFSLPISVFAGWLAVQIVLRTIGWLFANMGASSEARVEDLIGQLGEIIVPISHGRTGQVTYIIQSKRYTAPAKGLDPNLDIPKKTKVQICDIRDHVMYVEQWNDTFNDPALDLTSNSSN
jgi:membrane protein implicated in regulation of membrane protease activity